MDSSLSVLKKSMCVSLQDPNLVGVSTRLWQTRATQEIKPESWIQKCFSSQRPSDLFYQTFCSIWIWSKLHNRGKWPGKHLEWAEHRHRPGGDYRFKVWIIKGGLSLTWRQMLRTSCEGMRPVRKERASHCFLIQQDVRKSKAASRFSSPVLAPFHKLMAKAQREVLLMHASG